MARSKRPLRHRPAPRPTHDELMGLVRDAADRLYHRQERTAVLHRAQVEQVMAELCNWVLDAAVLAEKRESTDFADGADFTD